MAMMPHPERTTNGDAIFQSMRDYIAEARPISAENPVPAVHYKPRQNHNPLSKNRQHNECTGEINDY